MAQVTRSTKVGGGTTLQANTIARAADVETDMLTLFTAFNNHDSGSSKWTVVSAEGSSSVPLVVNNSTGTQNIAEFKDNGSNVLTIADGGAITATGTVTAGGLTTSGALSIGSASSIIKGPDGTAAAPTFSFASSGNTDNGMYLVGSDNLGFTVGGTKRLDISATAITSALPLAMGSNKITGLTNGAAAAEAATYGQLKVLQIVTGTSSTAFTTTSGSFVDTNLSASITPTSASNKILVIASGSLRVNAASKTVFVQLLRGSTQITGTDGQMKFIMTGGITGESWVPCTLSVLDSPATTSATTYKVSIRNSDSATTVGFGEASQTQSMILMEVV